MKRRNDCGQAYVITLLFMTVLLGMAAAVLDVGSWYRAQRALQATVDAAALAGAQDLPGQPSQARATALDYADDNGGGVVPADIQVSRTFTDNDTIKVTGHKQPPGFFSKIVGIDSVNVSAKATARASGLSGAKWVVPIVVDEKLPELHCNPNPCTNEVTLNYLHLKKNGSPDGAGNFGFLNLTGETGIGASTLGNWIENGFDKYMDIDDYDAVTGNNFSSNQVKGFLDLRVGDTMLFPVYRKITGSGTTAKFEIVGWVGFKLTEIDFQGSNEKLTGNFTEVTWDGIEAHSSSGTAGEDFGAKVVTLVE